MSLTDVLTLAVLTVVGVRLVDAARISYERRRRVLELLRGLERRHFIDAIPVMIGVVTTALVLVQLPLLRFGWWTSIGGNGNPVLGSSKGTESLGLRYLPLVFIGLLVLGLPMLVEREERIFRLGAERRSTLANLRRSITFGLVHAIVGIPIGAALALSLGGIYLTYVYLRAWRAVPHDPTASRGGVSTEAAQLAALTESTRAHLAYNIVVLVIAIPLLIWAG